VGRTFSSAVLEHLVRGRCQNGQPQEPGGWNRIVLEVSDLSRLVEELKRAGLRFRNEIETGPVGRQVQVEDPDGNPIELFEPAR
jgi:glyoxylase I family protein